MPDIHISESGVPRVANEKGTVIRTEKVTLYRSQRFESFRDAYLDIYTGEQKFVTTPLKS